MNFIQEVEHAFIEENNPQGPPTKKDVLYLHKNMICHKSFINREFFKIDINKYNNSPKMLEMLVICILILCRNTNNYTVEMYISEIIIVNKNNIFKKNFVHLGQLMTTNIFKNASNLVIHGVPIWPRREETDIIYPSFHIPLIKSNPLEIKSPQWPSYIEQILVEKGCISKPINIEENKKIINELTKKKNRNSRKKQKKLRKKLRRKVINEVVEEMIQSLIDEEEMIQSPIKEEFDYEEAIKFLSQRWNESLCDESIICI